MSKPILLMAHGAPRNLDEVEEYVLHIRHGRPLPAVQMQTIKDRYKLVGGSPLIQWTQAQAEKLQQRVDGKVYIGMRHSHPFISEAVQQMATDNVEEFIALCLTPQF